MNYAYLKEEAGEQIKTVLKAARLAPSAQCTSMEVYRLLGQDLCLCEKKPLSTECIGSDERFQYRYHAFSYYAGGGGTMDGASDGDGGAVAAKVYKNGDYVATLSLALRI